MRRLFHDARARTVAQTLATTTFCEGCGGVCTADCRRETLRETLHERLRDSMQRGGVVRL